MALNSLHRQALDAIADIIRGLSLTGLAGGSPLASDRVTVQVLADADRETPLPCVQVSLVPLPESLEGTTNNTDDIGYPVGVSIIVPKNQAETVLDAELTWRQQVMQALHHKRPAGLVSALTAPLVRVEWVPGIVVSEELLRVANLWTSQMVFRVVVRKPRDLAIVLEYRVLLESGDALLLESGDALLLE
jgi:hypothetical protein